MFSSLASFRTELEAQIKPGLPATWRVESSLTAAINALTPVLYFEFTEISSTDPGGPLARGTVWASCDLIITDPQTGDGAENAVDTHVISVITALDPRDDIHWDTARKERLTDGPLAWRVSAHALVATPTE